ncbi:hypothetical protein Tco_0818708 [Tanacetum coccineum]
MHALISASIVEWVVENFPLAYAQFFSELLGPSLLFFHLTIPPYPSMHPSVSRMIFIAPSPMTAPKKSIVRTAIFIFVGDKTKPFSSQIFTILSKCLACSFSFSEKTSISSIYMR